MAEITEHDSKQKGESYAGKVSGIDLLISRDAIGVDYLLEGISKLVYLKVGRWNQLAVVNFLQLNCALSPIKLIHVRVFLLRLVYQIQQLVLCQMAPHVAVVEPSLLS